MICIFILIVLFCYISLALSARCPENTCPFFPTSETSSNLMMAASAAAAAAMGALRPVARIVNGSKQMDVSDFFMISQQPVSFNLYISLF